MSFTVRAFCEWLVATPLSVAIQSAAWIVPAAQTIHILALSVALVAAGRLSLRLVGLGQSEDIPQTVGLVRPWLKGTVAVLAVSGVILIVAEPGRELLNVAFRLKMLLLVAVLVLVGAFSWAVARDPEPWRGALSSGRRLWARTSGAVSLVLWLSILTAGRWIAYVQGD